MAKKFLLSVVLLIMYSVVFSQTNQDSILVKERNDLFQSYTNEKASKPDPAKEDLINQVSSLENIINKDNLLIDSLLSYSRTIKTLAVGIDTLSKRQIILSENSSRTGDKAKLLMYVIYGLSGAVIIFIVLLIILSGLRGKAAKMLKTQIATIEDERLRFDEELKLFSEKLEGAENINKDLASEKEVVMAKLELAQDNLNDLKNDYSKISGNLESQAAEFNNRINQLVSENVEFQGKFNEAEGKAIYLASENEYLRNKNNDLEASSTSSDHLNKESFFQKQLEETTNLINQLVMEKSELENKIRELEAANIYKTDQMELEELQLKFDEEKALKEKLNLEKAQLEEKTIKLESDLAGMNAEFKELEDDYYAIKEKLIEKEELMESFRRENNSDFYKKIDEVDLRVIKIEKLDRLFSKEAITKEEYDALKQKFLSEF